MQILVLLIMLFPSYIYAQEFKEKIDWGTDEINSSNVNKISEDDVKVIFEMDATGIKFFTIKRSSNDNSVFCMYNASSEPLKITLVNLRSDSKMMSFTINPSETRKITSLTYNNCPRFIGISISMGNDELEYFSISDTTIFNVDNPKCFIETLTM